MTDGRTARTSIQVAAQEPSDARAARTSVLVAAQGLSDARTARTSVLVALTSDYWTTTHATSVWGMVPMGI